MKFQFLLTVLLSSTFIFSCVTNQTSGKDSESEFNDTVQMTSYQLKEIPLPFEAEALNVNADKMVLIGSTKMAYVDDTAKVTESPSFSIKTRYVLKEAAGSFTLVAVENNPEYVLCDPRSVSVLSDRLFVYAVCDHNDQIWKVTDEKTETSISVIGLQSEFTAKSDGVIFGPAEPKWIDENALLPAHISGTPRLYLLNDKNHLEMIWQGQQGMGAIASIDTHARNGWMLTLNGDLFRSSDSGKTWKRISGLLPTPNGDSVLDFIDERNGFYLNENQLYHSNDGGISWSKEKIGGNLSNLHASQEMIILKDKDGLHFRQPQKSEWQFLELGLGFEGVVSFKNTLYILQLGRLYKIEVYA